MTAAASILLAGGDDPQPYSLDAAVWRENLAALQRRDAPLADRLAAAALPADWRPVCALDGFPTWRTEAAGAPPAWLGGTALPRRRAAALLAGYQSGDRNPALPTLGTGAEALELLERLPPHIAVYVFLDDTAAAAAVLRTTPLAAALTTGRLILVTADDPRAHLGDGHHGRFGEHDQRRPGGGAAGDRDLQRRQLGRLGVLLGVPGELRRQLRIHEPGHPLDGRHAVPHDPLGLEPPGGGPGRFRAALRQPR